MGFYQKLEEGEFVVTGEITPPRGSQEQEMCQLVEEIKGVVDAVNINDSPMARMKMNAIAAGVIIQQRTGVEVIPHLTCRDRNLLALQSELLGAYSLGIKNILALTGDHPEVGDHPEANPVYDLDSIGLIGLINKLNQGYSFKGESLSGKTDFQVAAAVNPGADPLAEELERLEAKQKVGIDFVQSQPVYDIRTLVNFLEQTEELQIPVLIGVLPLSSGRFTRYLAEKVPGINIPEEIVKRMAGKGINTGVEIAREFLGQVKDKIDGVHIMSANRSQIFVDILQDL
ncbi:MAG: methylenetetrahydrofolate reductase [Bacillota bacterium]